MSRVWKGFFRLMILLSLWFVPSTGLSQGVDPWPFTKDLPFPWDNIEGLWESVHPNSKLLVSFNVTETDYGGRLVQIRQLNLETLEVLAKGDAYENNRIVSGFLSTGDSVIRISLRFAREKARRRADPKLILIVEDPNEEASSGVGSAPLRFIMRKISNVPVVDEPVLDQNLSDGSSAQSDFFIK